MYFFGGIILLAFALWFWWNDGKSWQPFFSRVCHRIRSMFNLVSQDEMKVLEQHIQQKEHEWESRATKLEATSKFSLQLQFVAREIERRLTQLEHPTDSNQNSGSSGLILKTRSIIRLGVRVTLSDVIWTHLGTQRGEDIEDHLIDAMIQGPFCPVCLKRVVGRDRHKKLVEVQAKCRFCGSPWDCYGTVDYPLLVIDLKRQIYQNLDQEYRTGGKKL